MEIGVRSSTEKAPPPSIRYSGHMVWLWNSEQAQISSHQPHPSHSDLVQEGVSSDHSELIRILGRKAQERGIFFLLGSEVVGQKPNATRDRLFQGSDRKNIEMIGS